MAISKTLYIEQGGFALSTRKDEQALSIIRDIIKLHSQEIHLDIVLIQKSYSASKLDDTYSISRDEDRILISDKSGEVQAIIFYREVSEPVTFKVFPI